MQSDRLVLVGVNHKTTPVEVREKLALSAGYEEPLAAIGKVDGIREYYLLSTCNRVELLLVTDGNETCLDRVLEVLFGGKIELKSTSSYLYVYQDEEAVNHLFKVAASLDSMVVGEAQILGQLKEAYRFATQAHATGPLLNRLLHKAFSVAKRVRSETGIGSSAVSISYAAVQLAKKIFGNLKDKKVLLIGAGEMAELAAEHLVGQGVTEVVVVNRTLSRAVDLAQRFNGRAASLEERISEIEKVDIIISSTGATDLVVRKDDVRPIMRSRRNRPLFFIDIAVPRDLDPALIEPDNVFLYDIDDLSQVVEMNKSERNKEAVKAARITDEETLKFMRWYEGLAVKPTIAALKGKVDATCRDELMKTVGKLDSLTEDDIKQLEKMVAAISSKILQDPLMYLKGHSCGGRVDQGKKIDQLHTIFGLGKEQ